MRTMLRRHWLSVLATVGLVAGLVVHLAAQPRAADAATVAGEAALPSRPPFADYVAGTGLVESMDRDVLVAAPVTAVVAAVHVTVGARVRAGTPLFTLDRTTTRAEVATREAAVAVARTQLAERRASLADATARLRLMEAVDDARARSDEELVARRGEVALATARLASADAEVRLRLDEADAARVADAQRIVRAPRDGEVLAMLVRPGELTGAAGDGAVRLGRTDRLQVRIDIDEAEAWRVVPGARARLYLRGNASRQADLRFEHIEPYVLPKASLSGSATERIDTRVLQLVYSLPASTVPLRVGQQVDVVVEVPVGAAGSRP